MPTTLPKASTFARRHPLLTEISLHTCEATLDIEADLWTYLQAEAARRNVSFDVLFSSVLSEYAARMRVNARKKKRGRPQSTSLVKIKG